MPQLLLLSLLLMLACLCRIPDAFKQNSKEYGEVTSKLSNVTNMPLTEVCMAMAACRCALKLATLTAARAVQVGTYLLFAGEVYAWFALGAASLAIGARYWPRPAHRPKTCLAWRR